MLEKQVLIALLLGHVLFDFYLQPASWIDARNSKHYTAWQLYIHSAMHGVISFFIFYIIGKGEISHSASIAIIVATSHCIIDLVKSYHNDGATPFVIDQTFHFGFLFAAWVYFYGKIPSYVTMVMNGIDYKYLVVLAAYLITLKPTSILISKLLKKWQPHISGSGNNTGASPSPTTNPGANAGKNIGTLDDAGAYIGYLERVLILTFILLNQFSAVGFLLAAKSVFRFGELQNDRDKKLTEYVMLGSLISLTCVIFVGLIVTSIVTTLPIGK